MRALMMCAVGLAALAAPAAAETPYDRKLEQAVLTIVAKKMGDIRGGFSYDARPQFVIVQDNPVIVQDSMTTGATGIETERLATLDAAPEGLAPAGERRISRIITF